MVAFTALYSQLDKWEVTGRRCQRSISPNIRMPVVPSGDVLVARQAATRERRAGHKSPRIDDWRPKTTSISKLGDVGTAAIAELMQGHVMD